MKAVKSLFAGLLIVLTVLKANQANGTEGFSNFPKSDASSNIWRSTVAISAGELGAPLIFSGTIIYKIISSNNVYYGVLTSGHALQKASSVGKASDIRVSKNIHFVDKMQMIEVLPGAVVADSIAINRSSDLGFFVVKANKFSLDFARPATMSWSCLVKDGDYVGLIGYPGVPLRPKKDQAVQILGPKLITKRMSDGRISLHSVVRKSVVPAEEYARFVGTTADSMVGNSGGPAFDESGALIGVLVGSTNPKDGRYVGSEVGSGSGDVRTHSVISDCVLTKEFARKAWARYLNTK